MTPLRTPTRRFAFVRPRAAALAILTAAAALLAGPALAADAAPPRLLTVTGSGEVSAAPDQAQLSAGVVTEAKTAAAALAGNTRAMNAVFATLKRMGIPDKAIQTSGFSVSPQYPPYNSSAPRAITGYQVSNTVTVKVDDLTKLGTALDALVSSGANQMNGVSFSFHDPKPLLAKAREEAVKDAIAKAKAYADAAGVTLGPIQAINESGAEPPRPMLMVTAMRAAAPVPVAPGEQSITASVTIAWEIR